MSKRFARTENGVVLEIIVLDVAPEDAFHPAIAAMLKECAAQVEPGWLLKGNKFEPPVVVPPTLDAVKAARVETLRAACEATIIGGFKSSALGDAHTYPSDIKAQINLMGSVTDSIMPELPADWQTPFWVCDVAGVWSWKMHNAGQIQQAGRDGKAHVVECQTLLGELTASVLAATTAGAVTSIRWPEGVTA
ncbi:hypothetical protein [Rhizobium sp. ZX09]|uniref:DUF4376 domain-containing protein n=1 Tax=Rhizobium sp. ZX09 TaxID=2291939 RepID=UPI001A9A23E1|nr:hypothetical protein [Rhizobium sp. ZX09]QSZ56824.1 hypothetical protein BTN45_06645 [Rhizobium sp. ZX09]